jgi:hypothetical protein
MRRLAFAILILLLHSATGSIPSRAECTPGPCPCGPASVRNPVSVQYHWNNDSVTNSHELSGMSSRLDSAGATWVNALAGRRLGGISFGRGAGGLTVVIGETDAWWGLYVPSENKQWLSDELWRPGATNAFVDHVLAHEMGHAAAGLANVTTGGCSASSTIMWESVNFNQSAPATPTTCDLQQLHYLYGSPTGDDSCEPPPPECGEQCNGDPDCLECECDYNGDWLYDAEGFPHCESPILISLSSNTAQYHLTSLADGVRFDINGDGVQDQVAWTVAGSVIGFLAMDRNGNGRIDSGAELFGNNTRKRDGTRARHGFQALADLEDPSQADGTITSSDEAYSKLLLWIDSNHDGLSSPSELFSLSQAGIVSLDTTNYVMRRRRDQHGNRYRYEGWAMIVENGKLRTRRMFDVFFVVKRSVIAGLLWHDRGRPTKLLSCNRN